MIELLMMSPESCVQSADQDSAQSPKAKAQRMIVLSMEPECHVALDPGTVNGEHRGMSK
jgi:hypothetical protein